MSLALLRYLKNGIACRLSDITTSTHMTGERSSPPCCERQSSGLHRYVLELLTGMQWNVLTLGIFGQLFSTWHSYARISFLVHDGARPPQKSLGLQIMLPGCEPPPTQDDHSTQFPDPPPFWPALHNYNSRHHLKLCSQQQTFEVT